MLKVEPGFKTLRFSGKQSINCFASWEDLDSAARDHVALLMRRFPSAIDRAKAGDVDGYVKELKRRGYFTASEDDYMKAVRSISKRYTRELAGVQLPTVVVL